MGDLEFRRDTTTGKLDTDVKASTAEIREYRTSWIVLLRLFQKKRNDERLPRIPILESKMTNAAM
jgi:hypothetical protein